MAEEKNLRVKLILGATKGKPVRFSYLSVFKPRLNTESGRMEYSVAALIPKGNTEDVAAIRDAVKALQKDMWLDKKKPLPPKFWNPLRDGDVDTKQNGEGLGEAAKGHYVLNCKSSAEDEEGATIPGPKVVGTLKGADGKFQPIGAASVKSGDWGRISVNLGAYVKGSGGVGSYLNNLQLVREGEPLGNARSAEDDFGGFDDDEDDDAMLG